MRSCTHARTHTYACAHVRTTTYGNRRVPRDTNARGLGGNRWARESRAGFKFALKCPQVMTHDKRLEGVEDTWRFFSARVATHLATKLGMWRIFSTVFRFRRPSLVYACSSGAHCEHCPIGSTVSTVRTVSTVSTVSTLSTVSTVSTVSTLSTVHLEAL